MTRHLTEEELQEKWRCPFWGQLDIFGNEYSPPVEPIEDDRGNNDNRDRS